MARIPLSYLFLKDDFSVVAGKLTGISLEENDFIGRLLQKDIRKF